MEPITTHWSSPANIALIKYWGKRPGQLPRNPSISMSLEQSVTRTQLIATPLAGEAEHTYLFEGKPMPAFEQRVKSYLSRVLTELPDLKGYSLRIDSTNSFPHSSGISSSASFHASLALSLLNAQELVVGKELTVSDFYRKASHLARLGSGSAARSVYGGFTLWGITPAVSGSSDEHAIPIDDQVHPVFKTYRDAVLIISSRPKSLSSSAGHQLMESNPYALPRFENARRNTVRMLDILREGDQESFIGLVEEEAMTLHGLIQASSLGPILLEPGTIAAIRLIRRYRAETGSRACFTLDAGPNIHLLYPESEALRIGDFIRTQLIPLCENERWIDDRMGAGPVALYL